MSSSSKSSESKASATTGFTVDKFTGNREVFQTFTDEVKTNVMNEHGTAGMRYLFHNWPLEDGKTDTPILGPEFIELEEPELLEGVAAIQARNPDGSLQIDLATGLSVMTAVTVAMKKDRREERASILKFNERIQDIRRRCQKIISERSGLSLNAKYHDFEGNSARAWRYLVNTYGAP
jgi:hypothetical protein